MNLNFSQFEMLYQGLIALKAQKKIHDCRNLDYSKANESSRNRFMRKLHEIAFPWQNETVSSKELVEILNG